MTVVFVCTGNTCRSPMAAALFARLCQQQNTPVTVMSAGLCADGSAVSAHSVAALAEVGLDIAGQVSRPVTAALCEEADCLVGMTEAHVMALYRQWKVPLIKLRRLGTGISDPYGGSLSVYRRTREELEQAVQDLYETLFGPIEIRPMTKEDIPFLASLETVCFADPWSEQSFDEEWGQPYAVFYVAHDARQQVVGYVGMHHVLDEGAVTNIVVHPVYRRRGVARALLAALRRYGQEAGLCRITLEVRASHVAAIRLYESEGFQQEGVRPRFYTHPTEDARLYSLTLKGMNEINADFGD